MNPSSPAPSRALRPLVALSAITLYLACAIAALGFLGVGGYRLGALWTGLPLAGGAGALAGLLVPRGAAARWAWVLAAVLIGLSGAAKLVDLAPPSSAMLGERLDGVRLDYFRALHEARSGHGWCKPTCPVLVRTYRAPLVAPSAAVARVVLGLRERSLVDGLPPRSDRAVLRARHLTATVTARLEIGRPDTVDDDRLFVVVRLAARR